MAGTSPATGLREGIRSASKKKSLDDALEPIRIGFIYSSIWENRNCGHKGNRRRQQAPLLSDGSPVIPLFRPCYPSDNSPVIRVNIAVFQARSQTAQK